MTRRRWSRLSGIESCIAYQVKKLGVFLLVSQLVGCQSMDENDGNSSIEHVVQLSMDKHAAVVIKTPAIKSVSIGIYRAGESFIGHYGVLDPGKDNQPTNETIYEIASVTKTFTGTLTAQALLDRKFRLEDDIRKYLNNDYPNFEFEGEPIRIKHLVTHTSGFPANNRALEEVPNDDSDGLLWKRLFEAERDYSKDKFFEHLRSIRLIELPGTTFRYSNVGTNLMGHILENVYGKTYDELLQTTVFDQAGMRQTKLHLSAEEQERLANGYNGKGELMPHLAIANVLWGAEGGLKSTLPDMVRYVEYQLDENNAAASESHNRLHKLDDGYWIGCFWWVVDVEDGLTSYQHDGGAIGTRSVLIIYPGYDMGIFVVTNNASQGVFEALRTLNLSLFGDLKLQ